MPGANKQVTKSNVTALAVVLQTARGTFDTPTSGDRLPVSNLRFNIQGVTIENDENLGTVARNAPDVAGKNVTFGYNLKLRPPGGADVPAANAYLVGRILQAAKLTEVRNAVAIPAAAEALGAGSTTSMAVLGTAAAATADLYKGFPLRLLSNGATLKDQLTAITSYTAAKEAAIAELLSGAASGNYQIPKFLGYYRSVTSDDPPFLSQQLWFGGNRYNLRDCTITGFRIVVPTSTRDQAAYPEFEITGGATIDDYVAEAAPSVTPGGAVPLYKDGDQWLDRQRVGGSNFAIDFGIQSESPPDPNEEDGSSAAEIIASTARMNMTRPMYAKDVFDSLAKADAQQYHPFWAQWGFASGSIVGIIVPQARFDYQNPDTGGGLINESGDLLIDAFNRGVGIYFAYA